MEEPDSIFYLNRDWDPSYLRELFSEDFFDLNDLWSSNVNYMELVREVETMEKYCLIDEDINMDDQTLCQAVEQIESE